MNLLFIDACQRGPKASRTYKLAEAFLDSFRKASPLSKVSSVILRDMDLAPLKGADVERRESLIDLGRLDDGMFALSREFASSDRILVAAPYWDLMFPAALKTYIEHIMVRNVTFYYNEQGPVGLCRADRVAFLTTSGSPVGDRNLADEYLKGICGMVGIPNFDSVSAQGLDIVGWDCEGEMSRATEKARLLGAEFAI